MVIFVWNFSSFFKPVRGGGPTTNFIGGIGNQSPPANGVQPDRPTKMDRPSTGRAPDIHSSAEPIFPTLQAPFGWEDVVFFKRFCKLVVYPFKKKTFDLFKNSTKRCVYTIYYMSIFMYSICLHFAFMKKQVAGNYVLSFFSEQDRIDKQNLRKKLPYTCSRDDFSNRSHRVHSTTLWHRVGIDSQIANQGINGCLCLTPSHQIQVPMI